MSKTINLNENVENKEEKDKTKKNKLLKGLLAMAIYFAIFAVIITFCEVFLRIRISGRLHRMNLAFLAFVPAEAMFFTVFAGFFKNIGNKITLPILILILNVYYCIQFVYYRIFGSLFSVSMMGMGGTAVGNFFWAMEGVLIASIAFLTIFLAPTLITIFVALIKKVKFIGYPIYFHGILLVLTVALWFGGAFGLRALGTDRQSAYYVLRNSSSDTDTTANHLGSLTTFIVEAGAYYLGIGNKEVDTNLVAVSSSDLDLVPDVTEENNNTEEPDPNAAGTDAKEEEEVKEVKVYDPWVDPSFDFEALAENTNDQNLKNMYTYLAGKEPSMQNEYTGMFEGYNLIYICGEGFWTYACDETVTPTLYKMSHNGIVLDNYYNSFLNTTTNGEFAFATSLWPDVSRWAMSGTDVGSFPQSAGKFMPYGIGDFFVADGVETYAFHNYYGPYYRRYLSWPNIGFENCKFMGDMKFTSHWPSSDYEMMEQSIPDYVENERFFAYYMTFSGHGPYSGSNYMANKNIKEVKEILGDKADDYTYEALCYLACNLELEKAMTYLLDELDKAGQLDKTVIVLTGDHYPYYLSEEGRKSLAGYDMTEFEQYHSTCIIYNSAIEEPIHNEEYCCNVDIVPTILNLFNIPFDSRLLMGTDVFDPNSMHTAVLYNKSFLNEKVDYNSATKEVNWKIDTSSYCEEALDAYLNNYLTMNDTNYLASINFMKQNFYFSLWQDAGLLTDEEVAAEKKRAAEAMAINAEQNAIEAEAERQRKEAEEAAAAEAAAQAEQEGQQEN